MATAELARAEAAPNAGAPAHAPVMPTRRFWAWLVGITIAVRAIFSLGLLGSMPLLSDAGAYSQQAADMVHGHAGYPYYWPPGTSYFLAAGYELFGVHPWVARVLTIGLSVGVVVTTTLLAARILRDRRAVMAAGLILALLPETVFLSAQPYAQELTLLCVNLVVLGALLAYDSGRLGWFVLIGAALGFGSLARTSTLSLLLLLATAALLVARRARRGQPAGALGAGRLAVGSLLVVICTLAILFPAASHNHSKGQGWTIAVNSELDLWLGNNPYTPNYKTWWLGQHATDHFPAATQAYIRRFPYGIPPTPQQRSRDRDEAERFVVAHPAVTALRTLNRARAFWGFPYTISNDVKANWGRPTLGKLLLPFEAGSYLLFGLLVIAGVVFARSAWRRRRVWFALAGVALFELPYALVYGAGRWHYPALGLLAPVAAAGLVWAIDTRDRWRALLHSRAFLIAAVVFIAIQVEYAYYVGVSG